MKRASLTIAIALLTAFTASSSTAAADESTSDVVVGDPAGGCGAWIKYFAVYALPPGFQFHGGADFSGCTQKLDAVLS